MADTPSDRPTPEALLDQARSEGRGKLKVFLGAAPGVGKTYAMLEAAQQRRKEGVDVVVGVVETHGRTETEGLLRGLETVPRRRLLYQGRVFTEMDLDALLWRKPKLALVDELAHTNVEGSRHPKRHQDVEELLAAGIDVYTTLNVQHLESLNDIVAGISRVRVRETLPDHVLELADEIELIDLPPDELIQRLRDGKVYFGDQIGRAIEHFFSKGNLVALRELALRVAAERVDAQMTTYMRARAIPGPWPTQDRLLVCVNEAPVSKALVRTAKRMADRQRIPWIAVHVHTPAHDRLADDARHRIADALRLAESLGGEAVTLHAGSGMADELLTFARSRNVTRILVGRPRPRRWGAWLRERVGDELLRKADRFEVVIVPADQEEATRHPVHADAPRLHGSVRDYALATGIVAIATLCAFGVDEFLPLANLSLVFLLGVLVVAIRHGLWPSLYASLLSFLVYNFFFTVPYGTFHVAHREDILTIVFFFVVAILTGNLAARLKAQAEAMRAVARRTATLYDFSRKIAGAGSLDDVLWAAMHHVALTLQCRSVTLMPEPDGRLEIASGYPPQDELSPKDRAAARWAWDHGQPAGWGSDTLPTADWLFLPLKTRRGTLGVLGVALEASRRGLASEQRHLLDALADQVAVAVERSQLTADFERVRLTSETEQLRAALLASVSHDLRTPLVGIIGSAATLSGEGARLSEADRAALIETILEEGERLNRYVQNLLDMTRLGYGALQPARDWVDLRELAGRALRQVKRSLGDHPVELDVSADLPAVHADPALIEQVLVNILDNAAKYAPPDTPIRLGAVERGGEVVVRVSDRGPGIPAEEREQVFDVFYRVRAGDGAVAAGTGLGLSICKGLVEAHGGRIAALAGPDGHGTTIEFTLPRVAMPALGGTDGAAPA